MTMLRLRSPYDPPIPSARRGGVRVGAASVGGSSSLMEKYDCSDTDGSVENKDRCRRMVTEALMGWMASFGDTVQARKAAFDSRATRDEHGSYWWARTFQDLLAELGACPPSGFKSGPDCEPAGIDMVKAMTGNVGDADWQFRAYWPDFVAKMNIRPMLPGWEPKDPGWLGRLTINGDPTGWYPPPDSSSAMDAFKDAKPLALAPAAYEPGAEDRASHIVRLESGLSAAEREARLVRLIEGEKARNEAAGGVLSKIVWLIPAAVAAVVVYLIVRR